MLRKTLLRSLSFVSLTLVAGAVSLAQAATLPHARCAWMFTSEKAQALAFANHAAHLQVIHPVWYALQPGGALKALATADDAATKATAAANQVAVMPTVASVENVAWTRAMLATPASRAAHINALVNLATFHQYPGLDLDYEKLAPGDAANLRAFITEVSAAMHQAGKEISMAVPAFDHPSATWDYALVAAQLDHAHIMAYDFHTIGTHAGPTAPLGWVKAVMAFAAQQGGAPEKFILGMPNYGVTPTTFCVSDTCAAKCTGALLSSSNHMQSCDLGRYESGRTLNCSSGAGPLFFDDTLSLEEKMIAARDAHLGGVAWWQLGGEPYGFFDVLRKHY